MLQSLALALDDQAGVALLQPLALQRESLLSLLEAMQHQLTDDGQTVLEALGEGLAIRQQCNDGRRRRRRPVA